MTLSKRGNCSDERSHLNEHLQENPQYAAKKDADRQSYVWDTLIKAFTDHMIAGTAIAIEGEPLAISDSEEAVRHMALVSRFTRRILGKSILEVYEKGRNHPRYTRSFLPGDLSIGAETAFFFMTVAVPDLELPEGYQQYRMVRLRMLETHALSLLEKYPSSNVWSGLRPSQQLAKVRQRTFSLPRTFHGRQN